MGWIEARDKHRNSGNVNKQATEDLVARRVLRGLGITSKDLFRVERKMGIGDAEDDTLWQRTRRILGQCVTATASGVPQWYMSAVAGNVDVRELATHKEAMELLEATVGNLDVSILMVVMKGTRISQTYFMLDPGSHMASMLPPPFSVVGRIDRLWVVCQETTQYVAQFGPYPDLLSEEE